MYEHHLSEGQMH